MFLLPLRYEDRTRIVPIGTLTAGARAVIEAEIELTEAVFRGKRQLLCRVTDRSGYLTLRFFHFNQSQQEGLARGMRVRCYGEVRRGPLGLEMVHPEYRLLKTPSAEELSEALTPIYPATEGVQQGRLRRLVELAFESLGPQGPRELLPREVLEELRMPSLQEALEYMHRPPPDASLAQLAAGRHPV